MLIRHKCISGLAAAATACALLVASPAQATPPAGTCPPSWQENTTLVNPQDPDFFTKVDKNGDGIICIKDWTGPDPDPDIGFLAIDNVIRPKG